MFLNPVGISHCVLRSGGEITYLDGMGSVCILEVLLPPGAQGVLEQTGRCPFPGKESCSLGPRPSRLSLMRPLDTCHRQISPLPTPVHTLPPSLTGVIITSLLSPKYSGPGEREGPV